MRSAIFFLTFLLPVINTTAGTSSNLPLRGNVRAFTNFKYKSKSKRKNTFIEQNNDNSSPLEVYTDDPRVKIKVKKLTNNEREHSVLIPKDFSRNVTVNILKK